MPVFVLKRCQFFNFQERFHILVKKHDASQYLNKQRKGIALSEIMENVLILLGWLTEGKWIDFSLKVVYFKCNEIKRGAKWNLNGPL